MSTPRATDISRVTLGDIQIDVVYRRVLVPGRERVELPHRTFELLWIFLLEPRVLHERTALLERVWPGLIVEDGNLSQNIWTLRRALGDRGKDWIRTIKKNGYVFDPDCEIIITRTQTPTPTRVEAHPLFRDEVPDTKQRDQDPADFGAEPARPPRPARSVRRLLTISVFSLFMLGTAYLIRNATSLEASTRTPTAIRLAETLDTTSSNADVIRTLNSWLSWMFHAIPDVILLAPDAPGTEVPEYRIELASGMNSGSKDSIWIRARVTGPVRQPGAAGMKTAPTHDILLHAPRGNVNAAIATMGKRVLARVLPKHAEAR